MLRSKGKSREFFSVCWTVRDVIVAANRCGVKCNRHSVTSSAVAVWENAEGRDGQRGQSGNFLLRSEIL